MCKSIKELIIEADRIISKHCQEKTNEECDDNQCKYCINLGINKGYLCTKVFYLANEYNDNKLIREEKI